MSNLDFDFNDTLERYGRLNGEGMPPLVSGVAFETAAPDSEDPKTGKTRVVRHCDRTGHTVRLADDLVSVREHGFRLIRHGVNWNDTELGKRRFDWSKWDRLIEHVVQNHLQLIAVLNHYGWQTENRWLQKKSSTHPVMHPDLWKHFADYTNRWAERYAYAIPHHVPAVIPVVELFTDLYQRTMGDPGWTDYRPLWAPHSQYCIRPGMRENLLRAWNASAQVLREHGIRVCICEYATMHDDIATDYEFDPRNDILGVDYYSHISHLKDGGKRLYDFLVLWDSEFTERFGIRPTIIVPEYGCPEYYDWELGHEVLNGEIPPGVVYKNRISDLEALQQDVARARSEGIRVAAVFLYWLGNMWHDCLREPCFGRACDRNGIVDVDRTLTRHPVTPLIERFRTLHV